MDIDVREIVMEEAKKITDIDDISMDMNIYDDLNISSIEAVALLCEIEERLNIEIKEEALDEVSTVEELINVIEEIYEKQII